jgi:hypothetical protein
MTREEQLAATLMKSFRLLSGAYTTRFKPNGDTLAVFVAALEDTEDLDQIPIATLRWINDGKNKWPPSPGELRSLIPQFCRCGECWRCNSRAVARRIERSNAGRLAERNAAENWSKMLRAQQAKLLQKPEAGAGQ